jgi:hypothetical protein
MTAVIAATSLVVSTGIALIAVPRTLRDDDTNSGIASSPVRASVTTVPTSTVSGNGDDPSEGTTRVPAVRIGDYFVAMLDQVETAATPFGVVVVEPDGDGSRPAALLASDETVGIAILSALPDLAIASDAAPTTVTTAGDLVDAPHTGASAQLSTGTQVELVAHDGTTTRALIGLSVGKRSGVLPLDTERRPDGACLVRTLDGGTIGVAVHHRHSTWLVTHERVEAIIDASRASTD